IYGLFRTSDGYSKVVSSGDIVFTLIGFVGLYFLLGLLFLGLVGREISHGPAEEAVSAKRPEALRDEREELSVSFPPWIASPPSFSSITARWSAETPPPQSSPS